VLLNKKKRILECSKFVVVNQTAYRKATPGVKSGIVKAFQNKIQNKRVTTKPYRTKRMTKRKATDEKRFCMSYYSNLLTGTPINKPECMCCHEKQIELLSMDHKGGLVREGKPKRSGVQLYKYLMSHNMPPGYQILCYNCNAGVGWFGVCPHKKK
jgi:hypothetical protein